MNRNLYQAIVVVLLLVQMGVVMGLSSPGMADTDLGVVDTKLHLPVIISTGLVYLMVFSRLVSVPRRIVAALQTSWLLLPLLAFTTLSSVWSTDPPVTMRRILFLLLSTFIAIILGADFNYVELARMLAAASLIHMALCGGFAIVAPHFLFSPSDPHALKGLTTHKNVFGLEQALAVLACLLVPFRGLAALRIPFAVAAFTLLILSHSSGSLVATLGALAALPLLLLARFPRPQRLPLAMGSAVLGAGCFYLLLQNLSLIPALLSKDTTLTGRTELWSLILVAIQQHPLLGYGFDSFWQGLQGDSLSIIRSVGWLVPTAHNGYLDLLLSLGGIGALLFLPFLLQATWRALRCLSSSLPDAPPGAAFFPLALILLLLIYNCNESALLTRSGIPFFFLVAVHTSLGVRARATQTTYREVAASRPHTLVSPLPAFAERSS